MVRHLKSKRLLLILSLLLSNTAAAASDSDASPYASLELLGRALFFDPRLSRSGQTSCATCHDPARAFIDSRDNGVRGAVSLGDDGYSLGNRNAPTVTYAALIPPFEQAAGGTYRGGLFHDGRASTLAEQASVPLLSETEMAMNAEELQRRLRDIPAYRKAMERLLGAASLASPPAAVESVAVAIAAYEASAELSAFDSRYDRYLAGELALTREEELGRRLFFSPLSNCGRCHLADARELQPGEPFTNFEYHNIGVPVNRTLHRVKGHGADDQDPGLAGNPAVETSGQTGKVRVPSLRNVAVTGPWMHNGVFTDLTTAITFYNQFLVESVEAQSNPESGEPWNVPEHPNTVSAQLLAEGQPLDDERISQLEAFLRALTDRRYESLLGER